MKTCNDCPFMIETKSIGNVDWLKDVLHLAIHNSNNHTCHKTDPNADGYIGGEKRICNGIKMLNANDQSGVHVYKPVYRGWKEFFDSYLLKFKIEGFIK